MIGVENISMMKLKDWKYADKIKKDFNLEAEYIELCLKRDRSSFAGFSYRIAKDNALIFVHDRMDEYIIDDTNKYDHYNIGLDDDYKNAIITEYEKSGINIGIEILFLVYSDVKSSVKIFEQTMHTLLEYIKNEADI